MIFDEDERLIDFRSKTFSIKPAVSILAKL